MAYKYYNSNPNNYHIPDCVIRAITLTTGLNYYDVIKLLNENGKHFNCDALCICCYEKLLDFDFGFPHYLGNNKTAMEVAQDFPTKTLLLRMDGHLSSSINGIIYDIFDCGDEIITDFWIVN